MPFLLSTQGANLTLLVRAVLIKRALCQTELARTFPRPLERQIPNPKHDLLHRLKRLSRFLGNDQVDPQRVQLALIPFVLARIGNPSRIGLCVDWTYFNTPSFRVQMLKIGLARHGRVIPLLQLAYDRDRLPESQSQIEQELIAAVVAVLPTTCRPIILADRGFASQEFFQWLIARKLDFVVRVRKKTCITDCNGKRHKLGYSLTVQAGGEAWLPDVRYALYHERPTDILLNLGISWLTPDSSRTRKASVEPNDPWYLATSLSCLQRAVDWYRRRFWIEESFRDDKSRLLLDETHVKSTKRLNRLLMVLTFATCWLSLIADPETGILPANWNSAVVTWGKAGPILLALAYLDDCIHIPPVLEPT